MNVSEAQPMTDIQLAPGGDLAPGLLCPECKGFVTTLTVAGNSTHPCSRCGFAVRCDEGVWRMLSSGLSARFSQFIAEYQAVRQAEARGASDAAYYLALPFNDLNGTHTAQWRIRASTFRHLQRKVLAPMAARFHRPLNILDLGAGNGWLSYRLSLLGHQAVAVDLLTNTTDGLGAASHYSAHLPSMFARVSRPASMTFHSPTAPSISPSSTRRFTTLRIMRRPSPRLFAARALPARSSSRTHRGTPIRSPESRW